MPVDCSCRRSSLSRAALVALSMPSTASAQPSRSARHPGRRVDAAPRIDGALDDDVWPGHPGGRLHAAGAQPGPAGHRAHRVRIVYDARTIYIAVHAYQSGGVTSAADTPGAGCRRARHPGASSATEMRRDSDRLFDEDNFQVILDTFNDSRNGYMFVTTPLGAKLEQQIFDEGEGGGPRHQLERQPQLGRRVGRRPRAITDDGWTAEIAIPLTTRCAFSERRAGRGASTSCATSAARTSSDYWAPIPKAYTPDARQPGRRAARACRRSSRGLDLKLKPFVVSRRARPRARAAARTTTTCVSRRRRSTPRYGVTAGLNLDVTLNTDFAQVEVDEQQVNLTRFGLFFPEKRDFFLENAELLHDGHRRLVHVDAGADRSVLQPPDRPVRHRAAGADPRRRAPGRQGRASNNIGVLDIQTDSAFGKPGDNFFVAATAATCSSARASARSSSTRRRSAAARTTTARWASTPTSCSAAACQVNSFVAKTARRRRLERARTWRSSAASRTAIRAGTCG